MLNFIVAGIAVLALIVIIVDLIFLIPTIHGAIFIPTDQETVKKMVEVAKIKPGERALDIGSGDGRIVIALAQEGAQATGYELNPLLVLWSKFKIRQARVQKNAHIYWKNIWFADFKEYDVITIYGIPYIMKDLEKKLLKDLKPGARVIAHAFPFPTWPGKKLAEGVWLYSKA